MKKRVFISVLLLIVLMLTACEVDTTPKVSRYAIELEEKLSQMYIGNFDYTMTIDYVDSTLIGLSSSLRVALDQSKEIFIKVVNDGAGSSTYLYGDYMYFPGTVKKMSWDIISELMNIDPGMITLYSYPGVKISKSTRATEIVYNVSIPENVYEEFYGHGNTKYDFTESLTIIFALDGLLKSYVGVSNQYDTKTHELMKEIRVSIIANAVGGEIDLVIPEPIMKAIQDYIDSENGESE